MLQLLFNVLYASVYLACRHLKWNFIIATYILIGDEQHHITLKWLFGVVNKEERWIIKFVDFVEKNWKILL